MPMGIFYIGRDNDREHYPDSSLRTRETEVKKLNKLEKETKRIIYEVSSVFPFQLFPDKLIIDENKITIIRKSLFFKRVFPIPYGKLVTVKVNRNILFAALEFEVLRFAQDPLPITYLRPEHANKAKKYITAMMQIVQDDIDITKLPIETVREKLAKIGSPEDEINTLF